MYHITHKNMITFKIDTADIILDDLGDGQGKIIIADTSWGYNFSYFWGAMGGPLIDFLIRINSDYFTDKLGPIAEGEINDKRTIKNIRRAIREQFNIEYPWYKEKEFQKELREEINNLGEEGFVSTDHFFNKINHFTNNLNYYLIDDVYERKNIQQLIKDIFNEPWSYLDYDEHKQNVYLTKLHKKLVKELKKDKYKPELIVSI